MFRIRRFGVMRTATVVALIYGVLIAVIAIPIALVLLVFGAAVPGAADDAGTAGLGTLLLGLVLAIFYGIVGWIFTATFCLVYNLVARWTGGIEVHVDRVEPAGAAPVPAGWGSAGYPGYGPRDWGAGRDSPPVGPPPTTAGT